MDRDHDASTPSQISRSQPKAFKNYTPSIGIGPSFCDVGGYSDSRDVGQAHVVLRISSDSPPKHNCSPGHAKLRELLSNRNGINSSQPCARQARNQAVFVIQWVCHGSSYLFLLCCITRRWIRGVGNGNSLPGAGVPFGLPP